MYLIKLVFPVFVRKSLNHYCFPNSLGHWCVLFGEVFFTYLVELFQLPDHAPSNHLVNPFVASLLQNVLIALDPDGDGVIEAEGATQGPGPCRTLFRQVGTVSLPRSLEHCKK